MRVYKLKDPAGNEELQRKYKYAAEYVRYLMDNKSGPEAMRLMEASMAKAAADQKSAKVEFEKMQNTVKDAVTAVSDMTIAANALVAEAKRYSLEAAVNAPGKDSAKSAAAASTIAEQNAKEMADLQSRIKALFAQNKNALVAKGTMTTILHDARQIQQDAAEAFQSVKEETAKAAAAADEAVKDKAAFDATASATAKLAAAKQSALVTLTDAVNTVNAALKTVAVAASSISRVTDSVLEPDAKKVVATAEGVKKTGTDFVNTVQSITTFETAKDEADVAKVVASFTESMGEIVKRAEAVVAEAERVKNLVAEAAAKTVLVGLEAKKQRAKNTILEATKCVTGSKERVSDALVQVGKIDAVNDSKLKQAVSDAIATANNVVIAAQTILGLLTVLSGEIDAAAEESVVTGIIAKTKQAADNYSDKADNAAKELIAAAKDAETKTAEAAEAAKAEKEAREAADAAEKAKAAEAKKKVQDEAEAKKAQESAKPSAVPVPGVNQIDPTFAKAHPRVINKSLVPTAMTKSWKSFIAGDKTLGDYDAEFVRQYKSLIESTEEVDVARLQAAAYAFSTPDKTSQLYRKAKAFAQ